MTIAVSPSGMRRIARQQGLIVGGILSVCGLIAIVLLRLFSTALSYFTSTIYGNVFNLIYVLAFLAFFFAGWRAGRRTGRVDMGALAGFWTGVVAAGVGIVFYIVVIFIVYGSYTTSRSALASLIVGVVILILRDGILALLLGPALGALGGFVGRTFAEGGAASTTSGTANQPTQTPQTPPGGTPGQP